MADIELTAPDGHRFAAYRADPGGPPVGAVVVVQEIFGVNQHIRAVVDRYAEAGYVAVAPALFDRVEQGAELGYDTEGMQRGKALAWEKLPLDDALTDAAATAGALAAELGTPVGVVGYCYGGMVACALASRRHDDLGAAVAYYPSRAAQLLTDDVPLAPLMIHLGDQDQGVTPADGDALAERWPMAVIHRYPTAGHGFNCDIRDGFNADASAQAWDRTLAFFASQLGADGVSDGGDR